MGSTIGDDEFPHVPVLVGCSCDDIGCERCSVDEVFEPGRLSAALSRVGMEHRAAEADLVAIEAAIERLAHLAEPETFEVTTWADDRPVAVFSSADRPAPIPSPAPPATQPIQRGLDHFDVAWSSVAPATDWRQRPITATRRFPGPVCSVVGSCLAVILRPLLGLSRLLLTSALAVTRFLVDLLDRRWYVVLPLACVVGLLVLGWSIHTSRVEEDRRDMAELAHHLRLREEARQAVPGPVGPPGMRGEPGPAGQPCPSHLTTSVAVSSDGSYVISCTSTP